MEITLERIDQAELIFIVCNQGGKLFVVLHSIDEDRLSGIINAALLDAMPGVMGAKVIRCTDGSCVPHARNDSGPKEA